MGKTSALKGISGWRKGVAISTVTMLGSFVGCTNIILHI